VSVPPGARWKGAAGVSVTFWSLACLTGVLAPTAWTPPPHVCLRRTRGWQLSCFTPLCCSCMRALGAVSRQLAGIPRLLLYLHPSSPLLPSPAATAAARHYTPTRHRHTVERPCVVSGGGGGGVVWVTGSWEEEKRIPGTGTAGSWQWQCNFRQDINQRAVYHTKYTHGCTEVTSSTTLPR